MAQDSAKKHTRVRVFARACGGLFFLDLCRGGVKYRDSGGLGRHLVGTTGCVGCAGGGVSHVPAAQRRALHMLPPRINTTGRQPPCGVTSKR